MAIIFALGTPPQSFPSGKIITVERGSSVSAITASLGEAHIVAHPGFLEFILKVTGTSDHVAAGMYEFKEPQSAFTIAHRLVAGEYDILPIRVTFPEGISVREMGEILERSMPLVSIPEFLEEAKAHEGYLFPDTYLFAPASVPETLIKTMRTTFDTKIASIESDITASGHTLSDIVTMASLVEKEARTMENRKLVAGVLWNRISAGMPLQVDAVFGYIFGRDTYSPTYDDLKVDSPYNTYTHRGLPPGPINNPGMDALQASLHPTSSKYLYYLTDKNGVMHYATTYAEHQVNIAKYPH